MVGSFPRDRYSRLRSMNQNAFRADGVGRYAEKAEDLVRVLEPKPKQPGPSVHDQLSRHRRPLKDESFSLTIRADDGRTLLETRVEYMHQAFQRLTDWSIGETGYDVSAAISGPNGFYTNHRIKTLGDFAWLEADRREWPVRSFGGTLSPGFAIRDQLVCPRTRGRALAGQSTAGRRTAPLFPFPAAPRGVA